MRVLGLRVTRVCVSIIFAKESPMLFKASGWLLTSVLLTLQAQEV